MNALRPIVQLLRRFSPQVSHHFAQLFHEIGVGLVHYRGRKKALSHCDDKQLKLNIGSGPHLKENFLNLDFSPSADIRLDLRRKLPFSADSCAMIFSEHFVEHLSYPEGVEHFFHDCHQLLGANGVISISVPDTEWPLQQFCSQSRNWIDTCESNQWHPPDCETWMEHLNFHFNQRWRGRSYGDFDCHRFAYDYETMKKKLEEAGFSRVERRQYDPGLDSVHRKVGSLFVQAIKL